MTYFSNIDDGPGVDGLGCGPECKCGPCKAGLNGFGERYVKEESIRNAPPAQPPPRRSTTAERLNGWNGPVLRLDNHRIRNPNFFAGVPATAPRMHPRCDSLSLTVPSTFAALEEAVRRWISTCVVSRTELRPGVPARREQPLVNGNPSLRSIWERILQHLRGKPVKIFAKYDWHANRRVDSITFSTNASPPPPPPPPPVTTKRPSRVLCPPPTCTPTGSFLPSTHGFKFGNSFSLTIPLPGGLPSITGTYGLCGGMASAALDYFLSCIPIPTTTNVPTKGTRLFDYLFDRLLDSLGRPLFGMVPKFISWTQRPDTNPVARVVGRAGPLVFGPVVGPLVGTDGVQELTVPEYHATVRTLLSGRMVQLGLIYEGPLSLAIWKNHQVLAYGVTTVSSTERLIKIYDPNHSQDDGIVIRCELVGGGKRVRCAQMRNGVQIEKVRGFFRMPYKRRTPPCLP